MFDSSTLDVAIGIVFIYLLMALICSAANELIARLLGMRSATLEDGIRNLLQGTHPSDPHVQQLVDKLYDHPLIQGYYKQGKFDEILNRKGRPSYIPPATFALALLDNFLPQDRTSGVTVLQEIRAEVNALPDINAKRALLLLIDEANDDLTAARANVEHWFNDSMERVNGWYVRKVQLILLGLALTFSIALNADTLFIANALSRDSSVRSAIAAAAQDSVKATPGNEGTSPVGRIITFQNELSDLKAPVGWQNRLPTETVGWLAKGLGWLITGLAVSLGAPFWFDVLNKVTNVRSSGSTRKVAPKA